jgi:hypothetical protein
MIDIHIITREREPWLEECLSSIVDPNVRLRTVGHVNGDIGAARTAGFGEGGNEYVSYVDPDDFVCPGIFAMCERWLDAHPEYDACFTDEVLVDGEGKRLSYDAGHWVHGRVEDIRSAVFGIHHIVVYRRDKLEKCLPCKSRLIAEPVLNAEMMIRAGKMFGRIPVVGYKWRIHDTNACRGFSDEAIEEARSIVGDMAARGVRR